MVLGFRAILWVCFHGGLFILSVGVGFLCGWEWVHWEERVRAREDRATMQPSPDEEGGGP